MNIGIQTSKNCVKEKCDFLTKFVPVFSLNFIFLFKDKF